VINFSNLWHWSEQKVSNCTQVSIVRKLWHLHYSYAKSCIWHILRKKNNKRLMEFIKWNFRRYYVTAESSEANVCYPQSLGQLCVTSPQNEHVYSSSMTQVANALIWYASRERKCSVTFIIGHEFRPNQNIVYIYIEVNKEERFVTGTRLVR